VAAALQDGPSASAAATKVIDRARTSGLIMKGLRG
jgi:hypothetical protein